MLKQLGYDDAKIELLVSFISSNSAFDKYADGLQLEPDVTPAMMMGKMAA